MTHVINHTVPDDHDTYLHRAGRTGRAGKTGIAVTFVDWDDMHKWALINRALEMGIPEPLETYSSSPHLYTDLDIPEGTKGRLPGAHAPAVRDPQSRPPRERQGGQRSGSGDRPQRTRTDGPRQDSAEGGGTHDGAEPRRRRNRTRTRRPSTPPVA